MAELVSTTGSSTAQQQLPQPQLMSQFIPFENFADLLEKISEDRAPRKIKRLEKYFNFFREKFVELHGSLDAKEAGVCNPFASNIKHD